MKTEKCRMKNRHRTMGVVMYHCLFALSLLALTSLAAAAPAASNLEQEVEQAVLLSDSTDPVQRERSAQALNAVAGKLEQQVRAHPEDAQSLFLLGKVRLYQGQPEGARELMDKALTLAPRESEY